MTISVTKFIKSAIFLAFISTSSSAFAENSGISIILNQAKIIKLESDADTVVVGEPGIADVAVKDSRTIVLTGKGFGVTNLVILDERGNPIIDEQVYVSRSRNKTLTVFRRAKIETLSCTPYCEAEYAPDSVKESDESKEEENDSSDN